MVRNIPGDWGRNKNHIKINVLIWSDEMSNI